MSAPTRRYAASLLLAPLFPSFTVALAQGDASEKAAKPTPSEKLAPARLPDEVVTEHRIGSGGGVLAFRARAGAIRLSDTAGGPPAAEFAYIAYEMDTPDPARRPIVFAINGGPGAASAWLGLGALGPWRLRMDAAADMPSAEPRLIENAETWLPFTDIVLIDPPGTGFSTAVEPEKGRSRFYSVDGDIDGLAQFVREWLTTHGRLASPKYIVAESYGGIRAPRLAHLLSKRENIGVRGLFLISPLLDMSMIDGPSPFVAVSRLPSYTAINRTAKDRGALADAEAYASGEYLSDLLKGPRDAAAQARLVTKVTALTGLDPAFVRRLGGKIDRGAFVRERERAKGKVLSYYDGGVTGYDPTPTDADSEWDDPMLDNLRAPVGAAMTILVKDKLKWPIGNARYEVLNIQLSRRWEYGPSGRRALESTSDLRTVVATDPLFGVTIVHGLTDMVTPYYASQLLLDQMPAYGPEPRIKLVTYPAGHMLYSSDEGRRGMRDEGRALIGIKGG